ncbi:MAG: Uma2 family endonuclease [Isosphaeraceae bacterium]
MSALITKPTIVYPESDGQPMAEDTLQFRWIVTIKEGIDALFRNDPNVFVAGDLFWYPVEGKPGIRVAPDTLVVIGRPRGDRRSYLQWEEEGIPPQVVFEVRSPSNSMREMIEKFRFYDQHGVEEYYVYDPDRHELDGWRRNAGSLQPIDPMNGWVSPRLGIRFEWIENTLRLIRPDGRALESYEEVDLRAEAERQRSRGRAPARRGRAPARRGGGGPSRGDDCSPASAGDRAGARRPRLNEGVSPGRSAT